MSKPKVHLIPGKRKPPARVPDCNRPLSDKGTSPGGLPPKPIQPGWARVRGSGVKLHTHS